ncbi:MAG: hypothetical protein II721_06130, partial [Bacilli bacterium]|nr:hypothetical protein [Bacilli bacterium]
DFSGETLAGVTDGKRHSGFLRALVDSNLGSFPKTTDGAIYKAASGTYEAMNFGANGIGFRMRVSRGKLALKNLRLELRGGDGYLTYPIQLAEARNSDNEELPELTGEFQDFLINPGQTIEDESTVYKTLDGGDSQQTVLGLILGFHLVANDIEVGGELEIDEVFTYSGTNRVVLDDFNREDVAKVPNAWWGGSASGFIVRKGVTLNEGKKYTTPSLSGKNSIVLTAMGDSSGIVITSYDAAGEELLEADWTQMIGISKILAPLANGGYANYVINLGQLAGNGILDKIEIKSTTEVELAGVFLTSMELPNLDLTYPHIGPTVIMDSFERNIASLDDNWDASAAIQANIDAGVTGFVSYARGNEISTHDGSLHLPAAADYAEVTIGYQGEKLDKTAKYVVISAKGDDLNLMRFKFRGGGKDDFVYFNAGLAAEGVKAYGGEIKSPYVDNNGFTHYVFDLALNGLGVTDIFDLYYTGESTAEIGAIYFANDNLSSEVQNTQDAQVNTEVDLSGYNWIGNIYGPEADLFGVHIKAADGVADFSSFRIEKNKTFHWLKNGELKAYYQDGRRVDPNDKINSDSLVFFDMDSVEFDAEGDNYIHLHVGQEASGKVTIDKFYTLEKGYSEYYEGMPKASTTGGWVYLGGVTVTGDFDRIGISLSATGTNMTYESLRMESPLGTFSFFNNPETITAYHKDGTPVAASDVIPENGDYVYVDVANSAISLSAGEMLHFHYGDWGNPNGSIQINFVEFFADVTPYTVIAGNLPS